jgi:hypothetical protein
MLAEDLLEGQVTLGIEITQHTLEVKYYTTGFSGKGFYTRSGNRLLTGIFESKRMAAR